MGYICISSHELLYTPRKFKYHVTSRSQVAKRYSHIIHATVQISPRRNSYVQYVQYMHGNTRITKTVLKIDAVGKEVLAYMNK